MPVMVLTLAVGATQSLGPTDSARRQLALLPLPTPVSAAAPSLAVSAEPGAIDSSLGALVDRPAVVAPVAAATLQMTAVYERVRLVQAVAGLREGRQLALLPLPTAVSAAAPSLAVPAEPGAIDTTLGALANQPAAVAPVAAATLHATAVYERARPLQTVAELRELPPGEPVLAKLATLGHPDRCVATPPAGNRIPVGAAAAPSPEAFGRMLAAAARRETEDLIVYTDQYRDMGFPMGDVRPLYGVCTDVVVRAYRALGIDLQVLVHNAKLGTGDPSIDHRRVETLRRFFAKYGTSIPVTDFVEEFQPGDIVTYRRPDGRGSQTHIAIVSDVIAPSGRPMVVHNRGWGPQLEDALFANGMTGHYRFANTASAVQAVTPPQTPVPAHHAAQTPWPEAERLKVSAAAAR